MPGRELLTSHITWGVLAGLVLGKPLGILTFSWLAVRWRIAQLSTHITWQQIGAVGALAGIGFTVSIFISSLAFKDPAHLIDAKTAVLGASVVAGGLGFVALRRALRHTQADEEPARAAD